MRCIFALALFIVSINNALSQQSFNIKIVRETVANNLVTGKLYVNGTYLGESYENDQLKINAGKYPGYMRYVSQNGHVQGPLGNMADKGDFLLEIGNVKWSDGQSRTNILFHGGNRPQHSRGCVMLGAVSRDANGNRHLPAGHTLSKLRRKFYGTDNPNSSPNKKISVEIVDIFLFEGKWSFKEDGDVIQLDITQSGSLIRVKYSLIWEDGEVENYSGTDVRLINSRKLSFVMSEDGETIRNELTLSSDGKTAVWKLTDVSDGESQNVRLKKY